MRRALLTLLIISIATIVMAQPVIGTGTYDDSELMLRYGGLWLVETNAADYGGSRHETDSNGAVLAITFSGDAITIYGHKNATSGGSAELCIGADCITLDYSTPVDLHALEIVTVNDLGEGTHELTLTANGDGLISVDAIYISPFDPPVIETSTTYTIGDETARIEYVVDVGQIGIVGLLAFIAVINGFGVVMYLRQIARSD